MESGLILTLVWKDLRKNIRLLGHLILRRFEMITADDREFVNFLFNKLVENVDTDMIDLQDDDSCCDHLLFTQLELF